MDFPTNLISPSPIFFIKALLPDVIWNAFAHFFSCVHSFFFFSPQQMETAPQSWPSLEADILIN